MKLKSGFLTLIGLPNAGKSSLFNKLVGSHLAIVTPKAQTTRFNLRGFVTTPNLELVVTDTPGLQDGTRALNQALSKNASSAIGQARSGKEAIALIIDAREIADRIQEKRHLGLDRLLRSLENEKIKLPIIGTKIIPVLNKADLVHGELRNKVETEVKNFLDTLAQDQEKPIWISTKLKSEHDGLDRFLEVVSGQLDLDDKGKLFNDEELSDLTVREFAAEYIREQCYLQLGAELPYSVAIRVDLFDEKDPNIIRIEASLHVERESQKRMVIGKSAEKIKSIGTKARQSIEALVGKQVYLRLNAKVTPDWSKSEMWVERFGYGRGR